MSAAGSPDPSVCQSCGAPLDADARFCTRCGRAPAVSIRGGARREGVPEWVAVVAGLAVLLSIWLVISGPGAETETTDDPLSADGDHDEPPQAAEAAEEDASVPTDPPSPPTTPSTRQPGSEMRAPSTHPAVSDAASADGDDNPAGATPGTASAPLSELDAAGWRLLAGDGLTIVEIDLGSGGQTRHEGVGAPLAVVGDQLLLYRDSRLAWASAGELNGSVDEIVEVAALQRMFTRGRSADRPVVIDDDGGLSIWWPNNNANPQTWVKLRLADGSVLDSMSLSETVFGGPEIVATVGSGSFERVDGRWVGIGDLFASASSRQAIVGQRCDQPDVCSWVLRRRGDVIGPPERLPVAVGGPFDLGLVADADRILLLESDGVTDYGSGRFVPMVAANATTLTATNRDRLLAMADGAGIGSRSSSIVVVDLDAPAGAAESRIMIDALIPRWLVLVPPTP